MTHARPADAAIAFVLLGWWVISPAFYDDGWTVARQSAFLTTGGFSNYYDSLGASLPLGYWLEWAQHWLTQSTSMVLAYRVPALLCLAATWVLCRWICARILASSGAQSSVVLWTLAASFAVGAMAWGMTLRQEPVVALLVTAVMACTVRFLEKKTIAPLAAGAVLIPLAVTAHPAGIVSIAPMVVIAPRLFRWARSQPAAATTILTSAVALLIVLAFIGSDVEQRSADAQTVQRYSTTVFNWRDETLRYDLLAGSRTVRLEGFGTPLRRASVALIALAVLAFVLRRRRREKSLLELAAPSLAFALVLLILTPSKWPWHFGALVGLASLAVASETARLRQMGARSSAWQSRPFIAIGAVILAIAWSWSPRRRAWNALDLRTLEWTSPPLALAIVVPLVLLAAVFILLTRRREDRRHEAPWRVASWTVPVLAVVLIVFTAGVLVADSAKTSSWTLTRQNIESLRGDVGCGLADDLLVPVADSARPLSTVGAEKARPEPAWVPVAPVAGLPRFALGPAGNGSASSPWFKLPIEDRIGLFVAGLPGTSDTLALEWGRFRRGPVEALGSTEISLRSTAEKSTAESGAILPWRFFAARELSVPEPEANAVRVTLRNDAAPGAAVAVTAPVVYRNEPLTRRLDGNPSLVFPNVRTYFPCARLPQLNGGIVEVPSSIVATTDANSPVQYPGSSPFTGLLDLYGLERLPVADSENPPADLVVLGVDRRIPGAKLASPVRATLTS